MGLCEVKEGEKINLKQSKGSLYVGLFLFVLAVVSNIGLFFIGGGPPLYIIIICTCGIWGYFGLLGFHMLYSYIKLGQGLRAAIARYGEDYLTAHIKQSVVKKYSNSMPGIAVYFTDRFVIVPGNAVFEYSSIKRMYKQMDYSEKVAASCLAFEISDGPSIATCDYISDEEIIEVMQLCFSYNPNIVMDKHAQPVQVATDEKDKQVHIEAAETDGQVVKVYTGRSDTDVQGSKTFTVPEELTKEASRIRTGENMVFLGRLAMVMAAGVGLYFIVAVPKKGEMVDLILIACAGGMVVLTCLIAGVLLIFIGKHMAKSKSD